MQKNLFEENYHGILQHDGWTKVKKFNITAKVLNVTGNQVLVKGNKKGSYTCDLHKNLIKDIQYLEAGDEVGIKWNMGEPYIVGYRKQNYENLNPKVTGDKPVSENWILFFKDMELGE